MADGVEPEGSSGELADAGTQSVIGRPNTSEGKILVPGKFIPAAKQRSKSTEPVLSRGQVRVSIGGAGHAEKGHGGVRSSNGKMATTLPLSRGAETPDARGGSSPALRLPVVTNLHKASPSDPSPFLLPLQRAYAPNLLLNHAKATLRTSVRIAPNASLDETLSGERQRSKSAIGHHGDDPHLKPPGSAAQGSVSQQSSMVNMSLDNSSGAGPSIFGTTHGDSARVSTAKSKASGKGDPRMGNSLKSAGGNAGETAKGAKGPVEDMDLLVPSAKELKEAKELFRQFDTDGTGMLTVEEIQASLYFNNVDYEEITAIFGAHGMKVHSQKQMVSVDEFATFLCRRRRENANRQQSTHVCKHANVVRVYVSSCIHQHHSERQTLHGKVFPRLAALCASFGAEFLPVDLRFHSGPAAEGGMGPTQSEVMSELARVATEKHYLFLGLVGDLPGECVLPAELTMAEFETLKASAKILESASDEQGLAAALNAVYELDRNAPSPTYVLRTGSENDVSTVLRAFSEQEGEGQLFHSSFGRVRTKIAKSLNEQEITKCLSVGAELDQTRRTFLFFRTLVDMPMDQLLRLMPGKTEDEVLQMSDRHSIFRDNMADRLPARNVSNHSVPYQGGDMTIGEAGPFSQKAPIEVAATEYLDAFAQDVYDRLAGPLAEMLSGPRESALAMELDAHNALLKRNASTIQKLDNEVVSERVMEYIHGAKKREDTLVKSKDSQLDAKSRKKAKEDLDHLPEAGCPLIICAPPGSGRTATIAHLAEKFSHTKEASHFALIYRCIGATPLSSDGRLLLDGLCQDLSRLLATPRLGARPPSYNHLLREFMEQLRMLGNKKPVVLFLDGLDNLPATDHARRLAWLPRHLPSNVLVIASCRPQDPPAVATRYPSHNIVHIPSFDPAHADALIQTWLEGSKHILQEVQKEDIKSTALEMAAPDAPTRLHFRLCFDEAMNNVPSFKGADRLSKINMEPGVLIFECLGLIAVSIGGLAEGELRELLDIEDKCKETFANPFLRFHKMLHTLAPYLSNSERDARTVLSLTHDYYRDIILAIPAFQANVKEWNKRLAQFLGAQPVRHVAPDGTVTMNFRKLRYVVYHQLAAEMWEEACVTLCSLANMQSTCQADMSVELQRMFTVALRTIPPDFAPEGELAKAAGPLGVTAVQTFYRFFIQTSRALSQHSGMIQQPGVIIQMAANEPRDTAPQRQAAALLATQAQEEQQQVSLHAVNQPDVSLPVYAALESKESPSRCASVSADTEMVATGDEAGDVHIWDTETAESVTTLSGHSSAVNCLAWFPTGRSLVSGSSDMTARVWLETDATCVATYTGHTSQVCSIAVAPDGLLIVSADQNGEVHLWKPSGEAVKTFKGHTAAVRSVMFSPTGGKIASASADKTVRVWNIETGKAERVLEHRGKAYDVSFNQDATRLLSASAFATCCIWDLEKAHDAEVSEMCTEYHFGSGTSLSCCYLPTGPRGDRFCMASEGGVIYVWEVADPTAPVYQVEAHAEVVHQLRTSLNKAWLVSTGGDNVSRVWSVEALGDKIEQKRNAAPAKGEAAEGEEPEEAEVVHREHAMLSEDEQEEPDATAAQPVSDDEDMPDIVRSITLNEDASYGVSCSEHGSLLIWDIAAAVVAVRCACPAVARVVKFHPVDKEFFLAACDDGWIRVYSVKELLELKDMLEQKKIKSASYEATRVIGFHDFCIRSLRWAKDGEHFVTGSLDATVRVWSFDSISHDVCLEGHKDTVLDADMSPNLQLVVSASADKTVRMWPARGGKELWVGKHGAYVYSVQFTPDGRRAVSASGDRTARVWASRKGDCLQILKAGSALLMCAVNDAACMMLGAGYEGAMQVWDVKSWESPAIELLGHGAEIRAACFSQYGGYVVSASNDGSLRVFDTRTGTPLGALPVQSPLYSMALVLDESRAICLVGDEKGQVTIVKIAGVVDRPPVHVGGLTDRPTEASPRRSITPYLNN